MTRLRSFLSELEGNVARNNAPLCVCERERPLKKTTMFWVSAVIITHGYMSLRIMEDNRQTDKQCVRYKASQKRVFDQASTQCHWIVAHNCGLCCVVDLYQ